MTLGQEICKIYLTSSEKDILVDAIISRLVWIDENNLKKLQIYDENLLKFYSREIMILKTLMTRISEDKMQLVEYVFYKAEKILEKSKKRT